MPIMSGLNGCEGYVLHRELPNQIQTRFQDSKYLTNYFLDAYCSSSRS